MVATYRNWLVCIGIGLGVGAAVGRPSVALAAPKKPAPAPKVSPATLHKSALAEYSNGNYQKALDLIDQGLAVAPKDLKLLSLKGTVLLEQREYPAALAAYQAYLAAGATGANQREAQKIVDNLLAVESTFLDMDVANGPADVYLDSKTLGVFCRAAPTCHKAVLPGEYKVIVERPGYEKWSDRTKIEGSKTVQLSVKLVELPSILTVKATPEEAKIQVDGAAHDPTKPLPAGKHKVVASLGGYAEEHREVVASEGKPIELEVQLQPFVPVQLDPPEAELLLGGKPLPVRNGGIPLPPGPQKLVARAKGFQDRTIEAPETRPADYKLVVRLDPVVVAKPRTDAGPGIWSGRRKLAVVAGGVGLVAVGGGAFLGLKSRNLDDDAFKLCPDPETPCARASEANDLNARARDRALQANIAYGVAGGLAIAAAVLWFTGAPESRVAVTPRAGDIAGLDLTVRF